MILYHGYAVRWLHPDHWSEAEFIGEPEAVANNALRCGEQQSPTPPAQPMLMPLPEVVKTSLRQRTTNGGRKKTGHAGISGQGPAGETCGSCQHYRSAHRGAGVYRKCHLMRAQWTRGPGSDIRKGDPACGRWAHRA